MGSSPSRGAARRRAARRRAARRCGSRPLTGGGVADDLVRDLDWRVGGGADSLRVGDGGGAACLVALVDEAAGDVAEEVLVAADAVRVEVVAAGDVGAGCELFDARMLGKSPS